MATGSGFRNKRQYLHYHEGNSTNQTKSSRKRHLLYAIHGFKNQFEETHPHKLKNPSADLMDFFYTKTLGH